MEIHIYRRGVIFVIDQNWFTGSHLQWQRPFFISQFVLECCLSYVSRKSDPRPARASAVDHRNGASAGGGCYVAARPDGDMHPWGFVFGPPRPNLLKSVLGVR